jgi:hypothetical protein
MKTICKIVILSFLLCIGFIPNSTGASFEPAKTALYLGDDNPGNYSLLQYAIEHGSTQGNAGISHGTHLNAGVINEGYANMKNLEAPLFHQMMLVGHKYQAPFYSIMSLLLPGNIVEKNQV